MVRFDHGVSNVKCPFAAHREQRQSRVRRAMHTKAWSSKQASKQAHTHRHSVSSNQASERPTNTTPAVQQHSSVQSPPPPVRQGRPSVCMHAASQCPLACYVLYRPMQTGLCSGATFYNGNSRPYSAAHFTQTPIFFVPGFGDEKLSTGSTPTQTWERKVRRKIRRRRLRAECVRACVRRGQGLPKS